MSDSEPWLHLDRKTGWLTKRHFLHNFDHKRSEIAILRIINKSPLTKAATTRLIIITTNQPIILPTTILEDLGHLVQKEIHLIP